MKIETILSVAPLALVDIVRDIIYNQILSIHLTSPQRTKDMEYTKENTATWDSSLVHVIRWIILIPIGLGLFWLVETFFNFLIVRVLSWDLGTLLFYTVYIGGGCLLFFAMILATGIIRKVTGLLAPNSITGNKLLAIVYLVIQSVMMYQLLGESGQIWPFVLSKIEMTGIVVFMFYIGKQDTEDETEIEEE